PADTAFMAGFADQSHLTRAFQRQFAMTPGSYQASR
ncbi:helix-turn-helix domain-containing protein, partial [Klebsiella michiganensis]